MLLLLRQYRCRSNSFNKIVLRIPLMRYGSSHECSTFGFIKGLARAMQLVIWVFS
jgi:hypothetical protein